jgi:2-haloalkanoic acid dehalogenase type II
MSRPTFVLFDVNETLSDLQPLRARLEEVGAPGQLLELWFASTLRDGFALTAAGAYADFRTVALGVLRGQLAHVEALRGDAGEVAEHIVAGFGELDVHPDVPDGVRRLANAGVRMATLTNGAAEVAEKLLERAGLSELVEAACRSTRCGAGSLRRTPTRTPCASSPSRPRSVFSWLCTPGTSTAPSVPACRRPGSTASVLPTPTSSNGRTQPRRRSAASPRRCSPLERQPSA